MKLQIRVASVMIAAAVVALAGCSAAQEEASRFLYEASASKSGSQIKYMETVDAAEPIGFNTNMDETDWAYAPELNPRTTTPSVSVTPPAGGTAACRILRIQGTAVSVVAEQNGEIDAEVVCEARQPEHESNR